MLAGMAEAYYATIAPHNPLGPISLAAGIQIAASIPNFLCQEQVSLGDGYIKTPFQVENGHINVPTGPGLGIELDEDKLADKIGHDWRNQEAYDAEDEDKTEALEPRREQVAGELQAVEEDLQGYAPDVRAVAGAIVTLDRSGEAVIHRGLLREGFRADVAVFDAADFIDRATYADPHQYPSGSRTCVIVNGALVSFLMEGLHQRIQKLKAGKDKNAQS